MGGVSLRNYNSGEHCKLTFLRLDNLAYSFSGTWLVSAQDVHEAAECGALLSMLSALANAPVILQELCWTCVACTRLLNAEQLHVSLRAYVRSQPGCRPRIQILNAL